jgi:hypothetical protein
MNEINYRKASNKELRTIIYDDPLATRWDRAFARNELERRGKKKLSGKVDKHAGVRR